VGLTFAGEAQSEAKLLAFGPYLARLRCKLTLSEAYAFEQATQHRLGRKAEEKYIPRTQLREVLQ
jgi:hypothetical protein